MTWCDEFTLNCNDPEQVSEKEIKDFMEKQKDKADKEDQIKERMQTNSKKLEENKKKTEDKKGNESCRRHHMEHISGRTAQLTQGIEEETGAEVLTTGTLVKGTEEAPRSTSTEVPEEALMAQGA